MATFARGHYARTCHRKNHELKIGTTADTAPPNTQVHWYLDPSDSRTLRGIPAIGRNVQGAIPGTRPDTLKDDHTS